MGLPCLDTGSAACLASRPLASGRVAHHLRIGGGSYERRRTYAFAEIAGLRLNGYDAEPHSYMPVNTLRNGETRWLSTANGSHLICAMTIEAICAETGLQKLGKHHR